MIIREATVIDVGIIHSLANAIWCPTYREILEPEQIRFMLDNMYSEKALKEQMSEGIHFLLIETDGKPAGFAGYSLADHEYMIFKLHKIYVLPSEQGKGIGKKLVEHVLLLTRGNGGKIVELNVNRLNPSLAFYKKLGFEVYQTTDIPYHHFVLNDYVMRKQL
ncbi:MAG TPA: GNAT family N-acetyltransferase [Sphingobacteriaceae bacterium]|nr:GNAT family N-acetyltransferase [Sphingobacteriaceae bacterium]